MVTCVCRCEDNINKRLIIIRHQGKKNGDHVETQTAGKKGG